MKEAAVATQQNPETPVPAPERKTMLQRKCACGGGAAGMLGVCKECGRKRLTLQRYSIGRPALFKAASSIVAASMSNKPTKPNQAPRAFGHHSFGDIRVNPRKLEQTPISGNSSGSDQPGGREQGGSTSEPQHSQAKNSKRARSGTDEIQALSETASSSSTAQGQRVREATSVALIVEDDALEVEARQMRKTEFLDELQDAVRAVASAELAAVGRTADSCPYIEKWIGYYRARGSQHLERALRRYAPETTRAAAARDYVSLASERVRSAVAVWARTGRIIGVPEEGRTLLPAMGLEAAQEVLSANSNHGSSTAVGSTTMSTVSARIGSLFSERQQTSHNADADARVIQSQLNFGSPLDGKVQAQMENAFDYNFSRVRVHTNAKAGDLSTNLSARAFTIGNDIAFASGEYRPGTLVGDALIAHELAHVVQQAKEGHDAGTMPMEEGHTALEEDADKAAVGAVTSIWGGAKAKLINVGRSVSPRMRSGLRLSRCSTKCPTSIEMTMLHPLRLEAAALDRNIRTGIGAVAEMLVSDPNNQDWNGKSIRETLTPGSNTCPANIPNCANAGGAAGEEQSRFARGAGSVFTVGKEFSDPLLRLPLPARRNTFYDLHIFVDTVSQLHQSGLQACEQFCEQQYQCPGGGPVGPSTFIVGKTFTRGNVAGTDVTNVEVFKQQLFGGSRDWSDVLKRQH